MNQGTFKSRTSIVHAVDEEVDETTRNQQPNEYVDKDKEKALLRKVDLRLCTIAGVLCSLDLLDSGIISSASVTSMFADLDLQGSRYSVSIFIFTIASITFQLPSTIAVRRFGPRVWFAASTIAFGFITISTAFIHTWRQMIVLRVLLGISMSGIYPGLTYLISTWYTRKEQQLRFAFLQTGEVVVLATGGILNFALNKLDGRAQLAGWRWMYLVQGLLTCLLGVVTYWWMVDFPERAAESFRFLNVEEAELAVKRIDTDRGDVHAGEFAWKKILRHAGDVKVYGFAAMFFLLNLVSTALSYFLPIILQGGFGFSTDAAILLSAPPYYWSVVPVLLSSWVGDRYRLRGPVIAFNCLCLIIGFAMLGFSEQVAIRYLGTFLATGAYVSNWAALSAYYSNNIAGQWKRVFTTAIVTACNGAGGVAGSYIFRQKEAPRYHTAILVSISSHLAMMVFVGLFSIGFDRANAQQEAGKRVLEQTIGFRYSY